MVPSGPTVLLTWPTCQLLLLLLLLLVLLYPRKAVRGSCHCCWCD